MTWYVLGERLLDVCGDERSFGVCHVKDDLVHVRWQMACCLFGERPLGVEC